MQNYEHKIPENFMEEIFDRIFDRIFDMLEISKLKAEDLMVYLNSIMDIDEEQLAIECAAEEAKLEGISEGITEGVTQTAHRMLKKGFDPAAVADITGFPIEQIMAMR